MEMKIYKSFFSFIMGSNFFVYHHLWNLTLEHVIFDIKRDTLNFVIVFLFVKISSVDIENYFLLKYINLTYSRYIIK